MKPSMDQAELVLGDSSQWISPVSTHPVGGVLGAQLFQNVCSLGVKGVHPGEGAGRSLAVLRDSGALAQGPSPVCAGVACGDGAWRTGAKGWASGHWCR